MAVVSWWRWILMVGFLTLALGSCGGAGDPTPTVAPTSSTVTGATGSLSAGASARALEALCEITVTIDREAARAAFYDRAHATLHAIAAAVGNVDRASEGTLLAAKQRVEADLEAPSLPAGFSSDVEALRVATSTALGVLELPAPDCGA